jgi:hypothetical protein
VDGSDSAVAWCFLCFRLPLVSFHIICHLVVDFAKLS